AGPPLPQGRGRAGRLVHRRVLRGPRGDVPALPPGRGRASQGPGGHPRRQRRRRVHQVVGTRRQPRRRPHRLRHLQGHPRPRGGRFPETGDHKVWTTQSPGRIGSLSWADATLSFVWSPVRSVGGELREIKHEVRTLDTSGSTGDLRMSKAVLTLPQGGTAAVYTGKTIVVGIVKDSQLTLQSYTPDGRPGEVLWKQNVKGDLTDLDANPSDSGFLATAGDVYPQDARPVPGEDLA